MRIGTAMAIFTALGGAPVMANDYAPAMIDYVRQNVQPWLNEDLIVNAIMANNDEHAGLTPEEIDKLDQQWRAEVGNSPSPLIDSVMNTRASDYLRAKLLLSDGVITELFVTDNRGLNAAVSDLTSDYWQGDEEKFTEVFDKGPDVAYASDVSFDESTQTYQGQVSLPILDAAGTAIGTITIGLDAEALF